MFKPYDSVMATQFSGPNADTLSTLTPVFEGLDFLSTSALNSVALSSANPVWADGPASNPGAIAALFEADPAILLAQALFTAMAGNGHVFEAQSNGCACCGHDHGLDAKTQIKGLGDQIQQLLSDGLTFSNFNTLIDAIAALGEVDQVDFATSLQATANAIAKTVINAANEPANADLPADTTTTGTITVGGSASGTRGSATDEDWYGVELKAGVQYTFIMLRDGDNPHEDPSLFLYDSAGVKLAENDDIEIDGDTESAENRNSLIVFTPTEDGTFYLGASGWTTTTGDYTLYAEEGNNRPDFTLQQAAFFLTSQFDNEEKWAKTDLTYDVSALTDGAQNLAIMAMAAWAEVSGLTFTAAAAGADADIDFNENNDDDDGTQAFASSTTSNGNITSVTVTVSANWDMNPDGTPDYSLNSYRYQTYLHEVGHALGLGHAGPYNGQSVNDAGTRFNVYNQDAWNYTVMSYFDQGEASSGTPRLVLAPQLVDILAIQDFYGANTQTRAGDSIYGFNSTESGVLDFEGTFFDQGIRPPSLAIYDAGGTDTLDFSGYSAHQVISLVEGTFSSIGDNTNTSSSTDPLINNITIAMGTVIENAIGGSGNDTLFGNASNNVLTGNDGNDMLIGDTASVLGGFEGDIYRAYQAVFDRDPDLGGFDGYVDALRLGNLTLLNVFEEFVASQEFQDSYGNLSNAAFVNLLYTNILPGNADQQGRDSYTNSLDTGSLTRAQAVAELAGSAEFQELSRIDSAAFANTVIVDPVEAQVYRIYQAVFNRDPDAGGFASYSGSIQNGVIDISRAAADFVSSQEFLDTYGNLTNTQFVELLYTNVLPGNTDQAGRDSYITSLDSGALTRTAMIVELSESFEFRQRTEADATTFIRAYDAALPSDTLTGGAGQDSLFGGDGRDRFVFDGDDTGNDEILDFVSGVDVIELSSVSGLANFAAVFAASTQTGADTLITLSMGNTILLRNVDRTTLTASDFEFASGSASERLDEAKADLVSVSEGLSDDFADLSAVLSVDVALDAGDVFANNLSGLFADGLAFGDISAESFHDMI